MGNWNRLWIFFVIVAVGLVLSWGQIGQKAGQLSIDRLLDTETPCRPQVVPCAAYGADVALVLGPGSETDLLLKTAARPPPRALSAALLVGGHSLPQSVPIEKVSTGVWRLTLTTSNMTAGTQLRIELAEPLVSAVFPLASQ